MLFEQRREGGEHADIRHKIILVALTANAKFLKYKTLTYSVEQDGGQ